jgi:hypothetical protein
MSKTKKRVAAALAFLALAAIPSVALGNGSEGVHLACQSGTTGGCYG